MKNEIHRKPRTVLSQVGLSLLALAGFVACQGNLSEQNAETQWLQSSKLDDVSVQKALSSKLALQINLKSNRVTLYKSGKAVDQWNIASADVSGEFHDKIAQSTPTGIFAVEDMQACPEWLPRSPKDPATGKVATNEAERREIFKKNPDLFGPCGAKNPLGKYVIWFHGEYGVHGNAAEWILELANPEERRVSGGCIRNPNAKIKDVFHLVLDTFSEISGFKAQTQQLEQAATKKTITQTLNNVDMKIVVGNWNKDASVGSSANPQATQVKPTEPKAGSVTIAKQSKCKVVGVDSELGIAPTHEALPAKPWNMLSFYNKDDVALVVEEIPGTNFVKTIRGLLDKKFLGSCQSQS
jgi:lipoprotein-anchoring transpeptidase ErfK/SrfK